MHPRSFPALLAATALSLSAVPTEAADPDALKKQTVQISIYREGAEPDIGSGVILCQREDLAYILTAHHVIYGEKQGQGLMNSRRDILKTEIRFFRDLAPRIVENRDKGENKINVTPFAGKDLVVLTVEVPQQLPTAAPGTIPSSADLHAAGPREFPVTAIGYAKSTAKEWVEQRGFMTRRDGSHLLHDAQIEKGFSGGPLFDESQALVGLNVRFASRAAGGENTFGSREGISLAIDELVESIKNAVPSVGCIDNLVEDTSQEEAHKKYKQALRDINLQRWDSAVCALREAIELKSLEGGRVHLQGMRYTEYLPHYHLGLAYYHLKDYRSAKLALTTSETQRVIQHDKRYRRLKKIKNKANDNRNEEPSKSVSCAGR